MANNEHFDADSLNSIQELERETIKLRDTPSFGGRRPAERVFCDAVDDCLEILEEAITQTRRRVLVIAPRQIKIALNADVIHDLHARRLRIKASICS